MDVDQEIDQLISDSPPRKPAPVPIEEGQDTICHWNDCEKDHDSIKELGEHIVAEHIPEKKPFTCEWLGCPRKGHEQNSKFQLNTHVRSHTGEKPFACTRPGCERAFVRNDALQKHLRQHDTAEAENVPMPVPKKTKPRPKPKTESIPAPPSATPSIPVEKQFPPSQPGSRRTSQSIDPYPTASAGPSTLPPPIVRARHVSETLAPPLSYDWNQARLAGLYEDVDLTEVLNSITSNKSFWTISKRDEEALQAIRRIYPQSNRPNELESEDEFDEGVSKRYPTIPEPVALMSDDTGSEIRVLSRPRWQVKYVMAKAKLMLVEEENRMRREQLRDWMEREEAMNQGRELRDLGVAGKAFAEVVREDVSRDIELRQDGLNGHDRVNGGYRDDA